MGGRASNAIRYTLSKQQERFITSRDQYALYAGGIGAGKSYAGAIKAIQYAVNHPKSIGLVAAPTFPMLRDATQKTLFDLLPAQYIQHWRRADKELILKNGAVILFRSLDEPDKLRGPSLAFFWLDEVFIAGYYAWQILKGRLRQPGYPLQGWATGTPKGLDRFYKDFISEKLPGHFYIRARTQDNKHLPSGYVEGLGYTGAFYEQEVEGNFVAYEGLVYPGYDDSDAPGSNIRARSKGATYKRIIAGIDFGYTNPCAMLVIGIDGDSRAWVLDEYYERGKSFYDEILPQIVAWSDTYAIETWYADPSEPGLIAEIRKALDKAMQASRVLPGDNEIIPGIQKVSSLIAPRSDGTRGLYIAPWCINFRKELLNYRYPSQEGKEGERNPGEKPLGKDDHLCDAARYALATDLRTQGKITILSSSLLPSYAATRHKSVEELRQQLAQERDSQEAKIRQREEEEEAQELLLRLSLAEDEQERAAIYAEARRRGQIKALIAALNKLGAGILV